MRKLASVARLTSATLLVLVAGVLTLSPGRAAAQFGASSFTSSVSSSQAGAHADFTTSFALNTDALGNPDGQLRDAAVTLPAGLIGNPLSIERCSIETLAKDDCRPSSQVGELSLSIIGCRGVATRLEATAEAGATTLTVPDAKAFCSEESNDEITVGEGSSAETARVRATVNATTLELWAPLTHEHAAGEPVTHIARANSGSIPLYNVQPTPGHVATFAASLLIADLYVQVNVATDGRLVATIDESTTTFPLQAAGLTLWGVPAAASHSSKRCNEGGTECGVRVGEPAPFMTNPTFCGEEPLQTQLLLTSWQGQSAASAATLAAMTGCEQLTIAPSLSVTSSIARRDSPAGYEVSLEVPQNEAANGLATPAMERISVTLPTGTSLSPELGNGLQTCTEAQLTQTGCPDGSEVGTAEVSSPALAESLRGAIYIGAPTPSEKFRIFLRVAADGTVIELHGQVEPNEESGQVSAVFDDTPELPFAKLKLNFFGGAAAALTNPVTCGPATSSGTIVSYAGQTASMFSTFAIDEDSGGGSCPSSSPFAPGFTAGTTDPLAGRSSPFVLSVSRADGQQALASFTTQLPPGLIGLVGNVPACREPAADEGMCTQASEVGTATVAAGAGPLPLYVTGPVYLTGPYDGAPLGLEIVIKASSGPFELGTVLVRSRILVNPASMAITIASNAFPQIVGGVPLRLRGVEVDLNRPGFLVNPTSCAPLSISSTIDSTAGASTEVATPFQATNCAGLSFAPHLTASTQASASPQGEGASLNVDIADPASAGATIHSVLVEMPAQLRPRLTTIQHACLTRSQPPSIAGCSAESLVGEASVSSPATLSPLSGPIYLVAHGGTALPSLVMHLRGEGLEVDLEGELSISSKDVISAAFNSLPDVPISSFDMALPRGPHSMLGAITGLCGKRLGLAYAFADQSGGEIKGTAPVATSGCPRRPPASHRAGRARRSRLAAAAGKPRPATPRKARRP